MEWILVFTLGACIGSFLNVLVLRTQEGKTAWRGRSRCVHCEVPIDARDLIPIVSYFLLKRRCRHCRGIISWQYPIVEITTGLLFLAIFFHVFSQTFVFSEAILFLLRDWLFVSFLIVLFLYD